jgi:hypothetical protein
MVASLRQLQLIDELVTDLGLEGDVKTQVYAIAKAPDARPSMEVRDLITGLIERKKARRAAAPSNATPNAAPGYYLRADGAAIVVVENKEKTRTYGKRFTPNPAGRGRPSWEYAPGLGISVAELTPMTAADAARIGLSHGYCIRCCAELGGDTLSAAVSAKIGYGETCAAKQGWPYPKGRVAQQTFLDAS